MSNELQVFSNKELGGIRALQVEGQPWFVGKDIAEILGYEDTDQALRKHVDGEDKLTRQIDGSGQNRNMLVINESGMYSLILSSRLPKAKEFKRWVTAEVLPSIRATGSYGAGQDMELIIQAVVSQATAAVMKQLPGIVSEAVKAMLNVVPRDCRDFELNAIDWNEIVFWENVLTEWREFRHSKSSKAEADKRFIAYYNEKCPELKLGLRTLYRKWKAFSEKGGVALLDKRGRHGNHRRTVVAEITMRVE